MSKKLILACMAAASCVAFAVPGTASATRVCETQSDDVTCNNIAVGSLIRGHLTGGIEMTDAGGNTLWTCNAAELTGLL